MIHPKPPPLHHRLAPVLVAVVGVIVTLVVAWRAEVAADNRSRLRLENTVTEVADAIVARVDIYIALLRSAGIVLQDADYRTEQVFRDYVRSLKLTEQYPGIQGIGFAQRVEPGQAASVIDSLQRSGRPRFQIWPESGHGTSFPIVLLEPADRRNLQAIGYDMYSEPVRHAAMSRAWRSGRAAASGKVTLVQEIDEEKQAGFLVYLPVYDPDRSSSTRRNDADVIGLVYSPFRADDLFAGIFGHRQARNVQFSVFDGPVAYDGALLHTSADTSSLSDPNQTIEKQIEIAGRTWTVLFVRHRGQVDLITPGFWFGASGLLLTSLLALLVRNLVRENAEADRHTTALAASEQAARDSESLKQAILDAALDCIIAIDGRGRIVEFNPAAEQTFGYSHQEAVGRPLAELIIPPRLRVRHLKGMQRHLESGESTMLGRRVEVTAMRSDGTEFPAELALNRIERNGGPMFTAYLRDITERHESEARIKELNEGLEERVQRRTAELEDANRQLESFSYSVSHDLRAPARHVLGFAELLKKQLDGMAPSAQRLVGVISDSAGRMAHLIDDLLAFSRTSRQELRRTPTDMRQLVDEAIRTLAPEIGDRRIEWEIGGLPEVEADRALLTQVWANLLSNAVKYTRRREVARITIGVVPGKPGPVFFVRDNGTGFDMRYAHKLFGVFQRLHREEEFEGTGIGLANVARIIHRHGGRTWAESRPDEGATFYFSLPDPDRDLPEPRGPAVT